MLRNEKDCLEFPKLLSQLLSSIRDINRRLDELKWIVKDKLCTEEGRKEIVQRIERLSETRMCLIYSLMDVKKQVENTLNQELDMTKLYKELKEL